MAWLAFWLVVLFHARLQIRFRTQSRKLLQELEDAWMRSQEMAGRSSSRPGLSINRGGLRTHTQRNEV